MRFRSNRAFGINQRRIVTGLGVGSIILWFMSLAINRYSHVIWRHDDAAALKVLVLVTISGLMSFSVFVCIVVHKKHCSTANITCILVALAMITYVLSLL